MRTRTGPAGGRTLTLTTDRQVLGGGFKSILSGQLSTAKTDQDGDGTPVQFTNTLTHQAARQAYAELLFASDAIRRLSYIVAANHFYGRIDQTFTVPISYIPVPVILGGIVATNSYAGFAHVQYRLAKGLNVFAGLRYTEDDKNESEFNNFVGTLAQARGSTN